MLIQSFEDWQDKSCSELMETNAKVDCPDCHGWGCPECDFEGDIRARDLTEAGICTQLLTREVYFKEVIADLKKWCSYTRQDFLEVVAPFIQNQRSGGGATVWR